MRTRIVHRWRLFLFNDPGLPQDVLPADWPGQEAAAQFEEAARRLLPLTDEFVDSCLGARVVSTAAATSAPPPSARAATTPIRSTQGAPSR
jgi:DNA-binding transcriptional regulator PaaX